jgi:hypothetical protein
MPHVVAGRPTAFCGLPCTTGRADALETLETKYPSCRFALNRQEDHSEIDEHESGVGIVRNCVWCG